MAPPVIIAVVAVVAEVSVAGALTAALGATLAAVVGGIAAFAVSALGSMILGSGAKPPSLQASQQDRTEMVRQAITSRKLVYGRIRVSGPVLFIETSGDSTFPNQYLHIIVAMASHEVDAIENVYFGDVLVWDSVNGMAAGWSDFARINVHLGTSTQSVDTDLLAEAPSVTSNFRLQGVAYVYARLTFSTDQYPNGIPNISATVRGKKCYDPRSTTTVWTANPALCIRDYLGDTKFGLRATSDELDDTDFSSAANTCDETVTLSTGGTEARYELHGLIDTAATPMDILQNMLTSCGGKPIYSAGKFGMLVGAYQTPTISFSENDLRAPLRISTKTPMRDIFNAVNGLFASKDDNYVLTDYPPIVSSAYAVEDGSVNTVFKELDLPFTVSPSMAQRLSKIYLLGSRQQKTVTAQFNLSALRVKAGNTILFSNSLLGWTNKVFEVQEFNFAIDPQSGALGVDLALMETAPAVYDWTSSEQQDFLAAASTNLPNAFAVDPPGVTLSDTVRLYNETLTTVLIADLSINDAYVSVYEVEAQKSGDTQWTTMGRASNNRYELSGVQDGATYQVRARVFNVLGVASGYATRTRGIIGKTASPSDVTNFYINVSGGVAHGIWDATPDADLSYYKIRYSPLTTGAILSNTTELISKIARPATSVTFPAISGTYFLKAVDVLGLESLNAATAVVVIGSDSALTVVGTATEDPTFSGTKTGTAAASSHLRLDTSGGSYLTSGTYDWANVIDLGASYTSTVAIATTVTRVDGSTTFDGTPGNFDDHTGLFDGDATNFSDINVVHYVSSTPDDPAGTPVWGAYKKFVVGDFVGRAHRFRSVLTTTRTSATPNITALAATATLRDRSIGAVDIVSGTAGGGFLVSFSPVFKTLKALGINPQNMATGDYYEFVSKDATGFTIRFKNSAGTVISRTFDWNALGNGQ